jgi:hypothetical protein
MTDVSEAAVAAVAAAVAQPKPTRLSRVRAWFNGLKLVDEWEWILAHSWSLRFMFVAAFLSALEIMLPLLTNLHGLPFYPLAIGVITGAAFIARIVAQKREGVSGE